ncbi:hypothetical protein ACQPYK_13960 [Streptosporangium sp. CA-135522]|uniref:hypothetical protein n=1 Tax=Streptosporangium sp. CA-135522 TaxID=3240072 RepID=UPI003D90B042
MRHVAGCALLLLLLAAGCTTGGPTLDEAAGVLAKDAKVLERFHPSANKKVVDNTGKDHDDFASCSNKDTALRYYQVSGDFAESSRSSSVQRADSFALPLRDELQRAGYELDRGASWVEPGRSIAILRKKDPGITFIVLVQGSQPNVEIVGKTDCLPGRQ